MKKATILIWQFPLLSGTQQMAVLYHTSKLQPTKMCVLDSFIRNISD